MRADLDAERGEEGAADGAAGHARRRLARAGALEHVADVGVAVLPGADEVGVPGPRQVHLGHLRVDRPRAHPLFPVRVVAVGDLQRDRAAERAPVADAGRDEGAVGLDLHAAAAAVAELAARHVAVDRLAVELEPGGQALDDAGQARAVGLARGDHPQRHVRRLRLLPSVTGRAPGTSERRRCFAPALELQELGLRDGRQRRDVRRPVPVRSDRAYAVPAIGPTATFDERALRLTTLEDAALAVPAVVAEQVGRRGVLASERQQRRAGLRVTRAGRARGLRRGRLDLADLDDVHLVLLDAAVVGR